MDKNDTPNSVIIVVKDKNKILTIERSKTDEWMPLHWAYPGGHIQIGETPYYAAKRELKEETGLTSKTISYAGTRQGKHGKIYIYLCDEFDGEVKLNFEHSDFKWVEYDKLDEIEKAVPHLKQVAATALEIPMGY